MTFLWCNIYSLLFIEVQVFYDLISASIKCDCISGIAYVNFFRPDYSDYFEFGIGRAGKPSFFYCDRKFVDVGKIKGMLYHMGFDYYITVK